MGQVRYTSHLFLGAPAVIQHRGVSTSYKAHEGCWVTTGMASCLATLSPRCSRNTYVRADTDEDCKAHCARHLEA